MMIRHTIFVSAFFAVANALILHPSPPIRRNSVAVLRALNNDYDDRPSYRRYQRDGGESKNRFNVRNSNNYNNNSNNNEDDAYQLARELASRRGLNLSRDQEPPNIPMDSYSDDYRDAPMYGNDYNMGVPEQELPRIPMMDYNAKNNNYNEGYGNVGGGLKDLTQWGGLKEQNDKIYNERYEVMDSQRRGRGSMGQRYKNPQPPRQPPREVRPTDYRNRNDMLYQSGPSSQRSQSSSMGRRANYEEVRRLQQQQQQQPRQPPKSSRSMSSNSNSVYPYEMNRVNKLSELASTPTRIDSPGRRPMSQYPAPNAQYRPNIPYQQPPPFRAPSVLAGFASISEQMGRSGSATHHQFMPPPPPPPPYVQMPQYQQQRRQSSNLRPTSIPLSQLALQPHIQPADQPSKQSQSYSAGFTQQQFQQMPGAYNDRRQQQQQQPPSFAAGRYQSESFGGSQSASFTPLPFQQLSQADFTRPFQGSQENQQQSNTFSNSSRQPPPDFNGPPPPFDQGGFPPPFGQEMPPLPPPPFGPDVHIFQNPFMNEPMFQKPNKSTQPKAANDNSVKVPKDPNVEKMRRRTVSQSSSKNPGSGMKIPKDPLIERRRQQQQQQQSTPQSNDGVKVPKDPFMERQRLQMRKADTSAQHGRSSNQEVRVPKEPNRNQQTERRPKEPIPKTSPNNMRIPREPTSNSLRDKIPREPRRNQGSNMDSKGDDMTYEDFASFFDMPKL